LISSKISEKKGAQAPRVVPELHGVHLDAVLHRGQQRPGLGLRPELPRHPLHRGADPVRVVYFRGRATGLFAGNCTELVWSCLCKSQGVTSEGL